VGHRQWLKKLMFKSARAFGGWCCDSQCSPACIDKDITLLDNVLSHFAICDPGRRNGIPSSIRHSADHLPLLLVFQPTGPNDLAATGDILLQVEFLRNIIEVL
jgi:hypothetical protein